MKRAHGFLLRFIDLGLLLLMAFLVVAELNPTHEEALPGRSDRPETSTDTQDYEITFDSSARAEVRLLPRGEVVCTGPVSGALADCLEKKLPGRFLLRPEGDAAVQVLVQVMDFCASQGMECSVIPEL